MKKPISSVLLICVVLFLSGCYTYHVAEATKPVNLYLSYGTPEIDSTVPAGSVFLLRGSSKNGMVRARYHTDPAWYWISDAGLSPLLNVNSTSYDQVYASLESANPAGVKPDAAYDATIRTGPRGGQYYINKNVKKTYVKRGSSAGSTKPVGGRGSPGGRH